MRWQGGRRSDNVEDRRGFGVPGGGYGIGGCGLLLILLISILTGQNPLRLLALLTESQQTTQQAPQQNQNPNAPQQNDPQKDFISVVLGSTEDVWGNVFTQMNRQYEPPKLVLFSDQVQSACGIASAASGPFYCPMDSQVYLDLSFFRELDQRFGAPGDFAQAYVVAHEVGHHVQNLLGIAEKVHRLEEQSSQEQANALSVRMELQADCLAGVWGYHANKDKQMLEPGDVDEGLNAAAAVGDDRIQQMSGRSVSPESWTHGSSKMRSTWFRRGFQSGDINSCDTFQGSM